MTEYISAQPMVTPVVAEQSSFVSSWRMRVVKTTAVVMGASGLFACTSTGESVTPDTYSYSSPAPESLQPPSTEPSPLASGPTLPNPAGVCRPYVDPNATAKQKRDAAPGCIDAMESGRAAFITYGMSTERAERLADGVERHISAVSMDAIRLSVDVVPATKKAQDAVQKATKGKCVDSADSDDSAKLTSDAANSAMPELQKYDFVIGATPVPECSSANFGIAETGGRYADIFMNMIDEVYPSSYFSSEEVDVVVTAVTAHELGHLYGLGHAGRIVRQQKDGSYIDLGAGVPANKTFNLKKYLKTARLEEYTSSPDKERGESDPMGRDNRTVGQICNIVHLDDLTAPREALYGDEASPSERVGTQWTVFTAEDAASKQFARVTLRSPIKMVAADTKDDMVYDSIAVVPQGYGDPFLYGVELFLTNSGNDVASLGTLGILDGASSKAWTLQYGSQKIQLDLSSSQLKVRTLSQ